MILYQVDNYRMLMVFAVLNMRNKNEKGAVLFPLWPPLDWPDDERLKLLFDEVHGYPNFFQKYPKDFVSIKEYGDAMFRNIFQEELEDFDEIYTSGVQLPFVGYLTLHNIHYNFVEDSPGWYFKRMQWLQVVMERDGEVGALLWSLGVAEMDNNPCIDKIYTAIPDGMEIADSRIVPFYENDLLKSLTSEEIEKLNLVFWKSELNDIHFERATLFAPSGIIYQEWFDVIRVSVDIYARILDYFVEDGSVLLIKPHPIDTWNYSISFPDSKTIPRSCPMELVMCNLPPRKLHAIGVCTSAIENDFFQDAVGFNIETLKPYRFLEWLQKAHIYYGVKFIFDEVAKNKSWEFLNQGTHDSRLAPGFFSIFGIHEIDVEDVPSSKNLFVAIDCDYIDKGNLKEIIKRTNYVIVFICPQESMLDVGSCCPVSVVPKRIVIHRLEEEETREEYIYIFTNDREMRDRIASIRYRKYLKYSKEDVEMDVMTEEEMEMAALRGQLEATEKRLKQVLEENEELRAQIETRNP